MEPGHFYFCIASNVLDIFVRIQLTCYNPVSLVCGVVFFLVFVFFKSVYLNIFFISLLELFMLKICKIKRSRAQKDRDVMQI